MNSVQEVKQYTNCVFTLNNYNDIDYNNLINNNNIKYIIIGKEIGKEGTPHLQGYFELKKRLRFNQIKKINNRMHFESRRGTQQQAIDYCKKDGDYKEFGSCKTQGERNDLKKLKIDLSDGKSIRSILENNDIGYQALRFCQIAQPYLLKNKLFKRNCIWCYGPTGSGKSHFAKNFAPLDEIYFKQKDSKWWDGYDGQKIVVMDEFRASDMKLSNLLTLLDDLPYRIEYKGGSTLLQAEMIIITTPRDPIHTYSNCGEDINQLLRRITTKEFLCSVQEVKGNTIPLLPEQKLDDYFGSLKQQ